MNGAPRPENGCRRLPAWQWLIILLVPAMAAYGLAQYARSLESPLPALPAEGQLVTYTDSGFSPAVLSITRGTTVTFKNASAGEMRVASIPHPLHDEYPTKNGCISSTFDSCDAVLPGQSWSFQFDIAGTWGYHDHLNASHTGTVIAQ